MPRTRLSSSILTDYVHKLRQAESTRKKCEVLFQAGNLSQNDLEQVYTGLFLDIYTAFERSIEILFLKLLCKKIRLSTYGRGKTKANFKTEQIAREILQRNEDFLQWLPYSHTKNRAEIFFENGLPFSDLSNGYQGVLGQMVIVRNAIAHLSEFSEKKFNEKIIANMILTDSEKRPRGFLRSQFSGNPTQTRFEYYSSQLLSIMTHLTT